MYNGLNYDWFDGPNRYVCNALSEMRACVAPMGSDITRRHLLSLIEEVQTGVNRMESALEDWSDIREGQNRRSELRKELKKLDEKIKAKKAELGEDE
jgi:seryl-tRNA synthetase